MHRNNPSLLWAGTLAAVLMTVLTLAACRHTAPAAAAMLADAEALIAAHPDSVKAYEYKLLSAIHEAERTKDWNVCSDAYLLLAKQRQWTDESEALHLARKALAALDSMDVNTATTPRRLRTQLAVADYQLQTGDTTHARSLYYICLENATAQQLTGCRNTALGQLANLSIAEGHPQEALKLAKQMTQTTDSVAADIEACFILAACYLQCDSLVQARAAYQRLDTLANTKARYVALRHLAEIAVAQRDFATIPLLVDSAFASAEAVFFEALQQKDDYYRASLEQEREAERVAYRHRQTVWWLAVVAIACMLTVVYLIAFIRHRRQAQRQRLLTEQRERELVEQKLSQQESMTRLLQGFIIDKSEIIGRLRAEGDRKISLSQRDWLEVEQTLDSITGGFVTRLRAQHPKFREEDIQLCMLTRMNLPNQNIANIYLITVSAVKHRKLKLKKDGFGCLDPECPLDDVVAAI